MFDYFDHKNKGATDAEKYTAADWCEDQELDCKRRIVICPDCFHKCHWVWWAVHPVKFDSEGMCEMREALSHAHFIKELD